MDTAAILFGFVLGVGLTAFVLAVALVARAGSLGRAIEGLTLMGRANVDPAFATKLAELLGLPPAPAPAAPTAPAPVSLPKAPPPPPKPTGEPLRLLSLLQTEARLVDFLMEDIAAAADQQIGQAVREIHRKAQKVLKDHLTLEEILAGADGDTVTVQRGFDPSAIRVIGNVTGQPPFTGELQHPGWKVKEMNLPPQPEGQNPFVIQPAEVQLP
ncbi:DUF2760 domain-containing protein [Fimbriiglobus ruber]|uniref:DUF2760 domain-containing protein n=1 Tax=Fimbriiglobus ruber TaxID=1908690 RepID=A0A225DQ21_9BACT|nr:DUF2760 domain-containing protein [Fimbriiglobus ruber]OWK43462.1 hypothetical protein FRUB_03061 [Fimbriiglobus ruber]